MYTYIFTLGCQPAFILMGAIFGLSFAFSWGFVVHLVKHVVDGRSRIAVLQIVP